MDFGWNLHRLVGQAVLDLVLPPTCALCGAAGSSRVAFCQVCERELAVSERLMKGACRRCGRPGGGAKAAAGQTTTDGDDHRAGCQQCRRNSWELHQVAAMWAYQDRVREAVVAAKYAHATALGSALGRRLAIFTRSHFADDPPDVITWVPSHLTRRLSRGGVGTRTIATAVAKEWKLPIAPILRAVRRIPKQAWLDDQARIRNVRGAFAIKKSYVQQDKHVLVVDDVLTTGATTNELARVLRQAGARRVSAAVVARALRK